MVSDVTLQRGFLGQYAVSDLDDGSDPKYYGFLGYNGHWYIMKENTSAKTYRYAKGISGYQDAWTNRVNLGYDYFSEVF